MEYIGEELKTQVYDTYDVIVVVGGIAEELLHLSTQYGYSDLPKEWTRGIERLDHPSGRYRAWFNIPAFVLAVDELMENEGVELLFDTTFCQPTMDGDTVTGVIVENKSGRCAYRCKMVIDSTGDSDVFYRAGAECFDRPTMLGLLPKTGPDAVALERLKEKQGPGYTQLSVAGMGDFRTTRRITGRYELQPGMPGRLLGSSHRQL